MFDTATSSKGTLNRSNTAQTVCYLTKVGVWTPCTTFRCERPLWTTWPPPLVQTCLHLGDPSLLNIRPSLMDDPKTSFWIFGEYAFSNFLAYVVIITNLYRAILRTTREKYFRFKSNSWELLPTRRNETTIEKKGFQAKRSKVLIVKGCWAVYSRLFGWPKWNHSLILWFPDQLDFDPLLLQQIMILDYNLT